ncbi:ABC transporter permease [Actinomadura rayongensis]|uniref:ABC transporter permease subunit n=1 Tax=Actinomadura rayongensis TaxID=1429076 RepID=A0A6I4WED3_9ACTN|nr:ABC transporter permease [Actinomadura rayongensis]MXQ68101.1 ABC transporter permease subunit [Actinomadura rayongensis]
MTTLVEAPGEGAGAEPETTRPRPRGLGLGRYVLVRFLLILPTVFVLTTVVFFLMRVIGDPITAAYGDRLTAAQLRQRIHEAGYDRNVFAQYADYLGDIARGDFGTTFTDHVRVGSMLTTYGTATLELVVYSLVVALAVGPVLGTVAARLRDRGADVALRIFAILTYATPVFFVGLLLKLVFAARLGWLPVNGRLTTADEIALEVRGHKSGIYLLDALRAGDGPMAADVLQHAVLPAVALGLLSTGIFLRLFRTNLMSTLDADYVLAARSRGVGEWRLTTRHAARPALVPIITVMGLQVASLLGGAVLTEITFEWKGLGYELAQYLQARDYVAVQGIVVVLAVIVAVVNFLVDVLAAVIDPRVRY